MLNNNVEGGKKRYAVSRCNKNFIRSNKAAAQCLEKKIWPLSLAEREGDREGGKWAPCLQHQQQLLRNRQHIRSKVPRRQKPELVASLHVRRLLRHRQDVLTV